MPLDPLWKAIAKEMPDARTTRPLGEKAHRDHGQMERVYCVNCGADGGWVTKDWAAHVFYLCDACAEIHGTLPVPQIPDALVRGG